MAKKVMGRPTLYKPEYCKAIVAFCSSGPNQYIERFAQSIDVHSDTLREWCKVHPEFSVAYKKAREAQMLTFMDLGMGLADGTQKGQVAAWCFMMKNMFGWRDSQELELRQETVKRFVIDMSDGDE